MINFDNITSTPELRDAIASAEAVKHFPYKEFTAQWNRGKLKLSQLGYYRRPEGFIGDELQCKYLKKLGLREYPDNHEAFEVRGEKTYYVYFSDNTIYIYGTKE